jgi:isoaspartyl peptidase/L-asparaginase-like protein (Ntn-hydrolase superfamily)
MLKEATGAVGGALLFSPLGMPFILHGVAGLLVGGAGLYAADSMLKQIMDATAKQKSHREPVERVVQHVPIPEEEGS